MDKTNLSVLLIEDDSGDALLLQEMLAEITSFQVNLTHVEYLNQGLQYLAENPVDLVLSDLTLRDCWGLEVLAQLSRYTVAIPVIVLTGMDNETWATEALQSGAQDYLIKGKVTGDALERAMGYAIERQRLRRDLQTQMNSLLRSESRLQAMIEHNADGMVIIDKAGLIRFVNLAAEQLFGRRAESLLNAPFGFPLVVGEKTELDILRSLGERVIAEMRVGEMDWEGQDAFLASLRDVTARKRIEEQFRLVVEASPYAIILVSNKGLMHLVNSQTEVLFGYSRQEMIGQSVEILVPDVFHAVHIREREAFLNRPVTRPMGRGRNLYGRRKDGNLVPVEIGLSSVTTTEGIFVLASVVDITERKRAEAEIIRRNRELALLNQVIAASVANQTPEVILEIACRELALTFGLSQATALLFNEDRTIVTVVAEYRAENQRAMLGTAVPVPVHSSFQQLLQFNVPLVLSGVQSDVRLAPLHGLLGRNGVTSLLLLPLRIHGHVIGNLSLEATEMRYFAPEEVNLAWSVADQVGGALAHARLSQLHQRLSTVVEQAAESVMITDTAGFIVYVNPAFERISGYSQAEAVGQNPRFLKSDQQPPEIYQDLWATISTGGVWRGRFVNKSRDGSLYVEDATITPVRNESGVIVNYVSVQRDVTRELQLEDQYRQAQKMEAVGRLAGGVAHDFNNMLVIINGYSEILLRRHLSNNDPIRKFIEEIHQAGERAAGLTRQLLAFSRKQLLQPEVLNLNEIISELEKCYCGSLARILN
ncbi:MAG: PAS domain S-box protein [Anaerolineales bacterium]|nr:PAS domain S-box protein [Anaerolineales bacterium]